MIKNYDSIINNLELKIFMIDTSGYIQAESLTFVQHLSKLIASKRKLPESTMMNFTLKRISITLQKRIGETIANSISAQHRQALYSNTESNFLEEERQFILENDVHDVRN